MVVKTGSQRFACSFSRIAAASAFRGTEGQARQQSTFDETLCIENEVVGLALQLVSKCTNFLPGCSLQQCLSPATQRNRDDAVNRWVQARYVFEGFFNEPVNPGIRVSLDQIAGDRKIVDDIAQ